MAHVKHINPMKTLLNPVNVIHIGSEDKRGKLPMNLTSKMEKVMPKTIKTKTAKSKIIKAKRLLFFFISLS